MSRLIWLASYPKSGNTWLRLFLESLTQGGAAIDLNRREEGRPAGAAGRAVFDEHFAVESSDLTCAEIECVRPRLYEGLARQARAPLPLKVHDAWLPTAAGEPLFPPEATAGAVYLIRDPRDVAVSLAAHLGTSIDRAIAMMADRDTRFGQTGDGCYNPQLSQRLSSWSGHVESWLDAASTVGIRLHLARYEEMVRTPQLVFTAIADFLGHAHNPRLIARAIAATQFGRLQALEATHGFGERHSRSHAFFRRGLAGTWRDELLPDQVQRIENDHHRVMTRLGYL